MKLENIYRVESSLISNENQHLLIITMILSISLHVDHYVDPLTGQCQPGRPEYEM